MMNNQKLGYLFITTIIALFLFSCSAPADAPIPIIENVQLQISHVKMLDYYGPLYDSYKPASGDDKLLVIRANWISLPSESGNGTSDVSKWNVSVIDENGREDVPGLSINTGGLIIGEQGEAEMVGQGKGFIDWVFPVADSSQSFTLHLPGEQTVNLDPFLREQDTE